MDITPAVGRGARAPVRGLVSLAKKGDRGALTAICQRYQDAIYRYCEAILHHSEEAKDALQNTLVSAVGALPGEEREIELKPWLFRIAHNEAISVIRRRRQEAGLEAVGERPHPGDDIDRRRQLRQLVADLESLGERQRGAIVMRELSDLSFEEVASAFGTSAGAARQLVYEARVALQEEKEGREMDCEVAREAISANDGRLLRRRKLRAHLRGCEGCTDFRAAISARRGDLAVLAPPLPALAAAGILQSVLGGGAATGAAGAGAATATGVAGKVAGASVLAKACATAATVAVLGGGAVATGIVGNPLKSGSGSAEKSSPASSSASGSDGSSSPVGSPSGVAEGGAGHGSSGRSDSGGAGNNGSDDGDGNGNGGSARVGVGSDRPGASQGTPAAGNPPPGQSGGAPGNSAYAPGQSGGGTGSPGNSGSPPGHGGDSPPASAPGNSPTSPPGNSGSTPSQSNPSTGSAPAGSSNAPSAPSGPSAPAPGGSGSQANPSTGAAPPGQSGK